MNPDPIAKLINVPGLVRVDRIGEFSPESTNNLMTKVQFSEIKSTHLNNPYVRDSLAGRALTINFHTSFLTRLKVGTIWNKGRLVRSADLLDNFQIDTDSIQYVEIGKPFKLDGLSFSSIIPDKFFPCTANNNSQTIKNTWYAIVKIINPKQQKYLVIPCVELFRFFFGVSSRLFSKILHGEHEKLIDWDKSNFINNIPTLHVNTPLSRLESLIFCKALTSENYKNLLRNVHKQISCHILNSSNTNSNSPAITIKFWFPFSGITSLKVAGKKTKLVTGTNDEQFIWVANVMEILECPMPFEFSTPIIVHDENKITKSGGGLVEPSGFPNSNPFIPEDINEQPIESTGANAGFKRISIVDEYNPFPGSEKIRLNHEWSGNRSGSGKYPFNDNTTTEVTKRTVGKGDHENNSTSIIGVDFYLSQFPVDQRKLGAFVEMLSYLKSIDKQPSYNWGINIRNLNNDKNKQHTCFPSPSQIGVTRKWLLFNDAVVTRTRKVIIGEIQIFKSNSISEYIYLLEMELKHGENGQTTLLVHNKEFQQVSDNDFETLLTLSGIKKRWLSNKTKWKESDGKNWMHWQSQYLTLKENFIFHGITHSSSIKEKNDKDAPDIIKPSKGSTKKPISPKQWSIFILSIIKNTFPQYFHKGLLE